MNDFETFIQRLNRTLIMTKKVTNSLTEGMRINRFDAGEILVSPGNYSHSIYFIQSGIVRGSVEGASGKVTTWFKQEGEIILPHGVFNQRPSEEYISALSNVSLIALPVKHIIQLMPSLPEIMQLVVLLHSEDKFAHHHREILLRLPSALERYQYLLANEDFVLKRIPHYLIASYINVSKETFSRLNKGLAY